MTSEQRAGENRIFVDVVFRVWFLLGNHKAFKCRSEDVVLSSIKQPEADGETQRITWEGEILKTPVLWIAHFKKTTKVMCYLFKSPWDLYFILSYSDLTGCQIGDTHRAQLTLEDNEPYTVSLWVDSSSGHRAFKMDRICDLWPHLFAGLHLATRAVKILLVKLTLHNDLPHLVTVALSDKP